jgi:hypothetical protein
MRRRLRARSADLRARLIAADPDARATWVRRLASKLGADGHRHDADIAELRACLERTVLPQINVAVLLALEPDVRAAMRAPLEDGSPAP